MAGLAGIYRIDEKQLHVPDIQLLESIADSEASELKQVWANGIVAMLAFGAEISACCESVVETRECTTPIVAFSGRLDNVNDIAALIHGGRHWFSSGDKDVSSHFASLLALGFQNLGTSLLSRISGDFAIAIWHSLKRQVILTRDPFGARSLYYCADRERICWASRLLDLLRLKNDDVEIDDEYVADYLSDCPATVGTPYRGIRRVEAGETVIFGPSNLERRRNWTTDLARSIRYKTDREYELHFADLFRRAVQRRLETRTATTALLSGGLDSSSVVCVADAILRETQEPRRKLFTVSWVLDGPTGRSETPYMDAVEGKIKRQGLRIHESKYPPTVRLEGALFPMPHYPYQILECFLEPTVRLMNSVGSTTLLCGSGGDQVMWSEFDFPPSLPDYLRQLQFLRLHREIKIWGRALGRPYWQLLNNTIIGPYVPYSKRIAKLRSGRSKKNRNLALINPGFVKRMSALDRWETLCSHPRRGSLSQREKIKKLFDGIKALEQVHCYGLPINMTFPFFDRDLVEFCLSIPIEQLARQGMGRSLHKRALAKYLPPEVAERDWKRGLIDLCARFLFRSQRELRQLFTHAIVVQRGYVDEVALKSSLDQIQFHLGLDNQDLLRVICLEIWFRRLSQTRFRKEIYQ